MVPHPASRDRNTAWLWAGLTCFVWYAFGAVPVHVAVGGQLELTRAQLSSWMFVIWFTGSIASLALTLRYRKPIPITWTIPGLIYLGTLAGRFSYEELVGANLVAGFLILGLAVLGIGERIMRWLPLPIVMGMFAGSVLGYATRAVDATLADFGVAGVTVIAYVIGRAMATPRVPPVGVAVVAGAVASALSGEMRSVPVHWALPVASLPGVSFSGSAVLAVSVPMVVLALGLGNVQGLGFLRAQGFEVPVNRVSVVVGVCSVFNALLGGHASTVSRIGVAILAGPEAGPHETRYRATVVAGVLTIGLALAAVPVASLLEVLPAAYLIALAGVAIFAALQDALERSFGHALRFGPALAFVVATTSFSYAGVTSAFWALVVGLAGSLLVDRKALADHWRQES
jgi:benzoate membrane transport protein